jgi:hypothetical protein
LLTHGVGRLQATYRETIGRAVADIKRQRGDTFDPPAAVAGEQQI